MPVCAVSKYVVPRLKCQQSGVTFMLTLQPHDSIFEYHTHWCALLAICCPSDRTVASVVVGIFIVVVVVGICNYCQMRTSKCTCLIFGVSIGLDLA